jgi:hypothetical protein
VFKNQYTTSSWERGKVTEIILATLAGYLVDCQATLEADCFEWTVEGILERKKHLMPETSKAA